MTMNYQKSIKKMPAKLPIKNVLLITILVSALLIALATHPYAPIITFIALSAWSLLGSKNAIQALSLLVLIKSLNTAIYQFAGPVAVLSWVVVATSGVGIFFESLKGKNKSHSVISWLLLFTIVVLLESVFFSFYSKVSIFKLLSFSYISIAILLGFKLTSRQSFDWTPWFLGIWIAMIILSIPVFFIPHIGFYRDAMGFQGILVHPQTFAVFLAPMVAWFAGTLLFSPSRDTYWLYPVFLIALAFMYLTRGRTALVAVFLSFIVISIFALMSHPGWRRQIRKGFVKPISIVFALTLVTFLSLQPSLIADNANEFILKGEQDKTVAESFESSRGKGIIGQWNAFIHYPLFGIGFGVSLHESFVPVYEPVTGLPLSAPTEKGLLPVTLLEETGIIGSLFFIPFIFVFIKQVVSETDIVLPWVFFSCLFINVGEMVFFSVGGIGLYPLLLMGWATCPYWWKNVPMK